jgi:hypothetical protein
MAELQVVWNKNENVRLVEGESLVFHCHHYNCILQKTIEDAKVIDGKGIQVNTAREVAYRQFTKAFKDHTDLKTPAQRLAFAATLFQVAGFGKVDFKGAKATGGIVKTPTSHYAKGWIAKWGKRDTPMCHFNAGWIAGAVAAAFDKERYYFDVKETACEAVKGKGCSYALEVR